MRVHVCVCDITTTENIYHVVTLQDWLLCLVELLVACFISMVMWHVCLYTHTCTPPPPPTHTGVFTRRLPRQVQRGIETRQREDSTTAGREGNAKKLRGTEGREGVGGRPQCCVWYTVSGSHFLNGHYFQH